MGDEFDDIPAQEDASEANLYVPNADTTYFATAGRTPLAPFVGAVTILPPAAFCSFTAIAYAERKSIAGNTVFLGLMAGSG